MTEDLNMIPVSFRVIGYGESFQDLIQEIMEIGYDGLDVGVLKDGDTFAPADEDQMLVVLASEDCNGIEGFLNRFHQVGVLTIVISTDKVDIPAATYDSITVANRSEMTGVVKNLLNPIFKDGPISFDFTDIASVLRDSGRFAALSVTGSGDDRMKDAIAALSDKFPAYEGVEDMSLTIGANERKIEPPLCMWEMSLIADYARQFPESMNIIWGIYNDDTLDSNTIEVSVIASGKNMKI